MAQTAFKGSPVQLTGDLPSVGNPAPALRLTTQALADVTLADFAGKTKVLNIFPSVDTGICAMSVRAFNEQASGRDGVVVLNISADLPFAMRRFCGAEGLEGVHGLSTFRHGAAFFDAWGVQMADGPMAGLCARAVVVVDATDRVTHVELVPEIVQEPDYAAALAVL